MDTELAALAASGATTLVSLMVTDAWAQARELVGRLFSRTGDGAAAITALEDARAGLLAADTDHRGRTAQEITALWNAHMRQLLRTGFATGEELHEVVTSLQRLAAEIPTVAAPVHNHVTGGVQHGPVIQSGRITGLTFHVSGPGSAVQS
ncbi:hypothetical protein [Streptomyces sp. NPDC003023]|uniref:hypothetical protein n=1 Tax=Streptomyces sp. NPDC003023 TaxID=3364675 RepID=UPI00369BDF13